MANKKTASNKGKIPPHKIDESMDLLSVSGLESQEDIVRRLPRGIRVIRGSWKTYGLTVQKPA